MPGERCDGESGCRLLDRLAKAARTVVAHWEAPQCVDRPEWIVACGALLGLLSTQQRDRLASAAVGFRSEPGKAAEAIAGLGAGLAHLNESQRERLVGAVAGLGVSAPSIDVARAISGLVDRVLWQRAEGAPLGPLVPIAEG
jgi:hypothetical protein